MTPKIKRKIFTIGHSNLSFEDFLKLLKANSIECVVDVRSLPNSRHNPQFSQKTLEESLGKNNTKYIHIKKLGGRKKTKDNSSNMGWENISFRGYADYMSTPEFEEGLNELQEIAGSKLTAIMCAEAKIWQCHRMLISDALMVQKWKVYHIKSAGKPLLHKITPFLRVRRGKIIYPFVKE